VGQQENICGFACDRDGKEKIKEKSLEATRLAEIKQRIERVLMYRLLRTEKVGIK
jgi:hypothetical protein